MQVIDLKLKGLKLIKPKVFEDERGFFLETYQEDVYKQLGIPYAFVQDNHSFSQYGCIRGMHFQLVPGQAKLVRVAEGEIFDVAVDIRPDSPTFGQWESVILDGKSHHQLFIPVGFAHGFCVMSPKAHVMYRVSHPYVATSEKGFRWDDQSIKIDWPIKDPILSERDQKAPSFQEILELVETSK